jgi:SAM-dependent methyltransferase
MYSDKIHNYQGDCKIFLGKYKRFSDYISIFACTIPENSKVLDLGTGPNGCNGKYFAHCILDGCDIEQAVLDSLKSVPEYKNIFLFSLGNGLLPYSENSLDVVVCSCVIQHLGNRDELKKGIEDISCVLKNKGKFYLMFKAGNHDTFLTHFNIYYNQERTFRVFDPDKIIKYCSNYSLNLIEKELLLDDNWIPYCMLIFEKE